jgi:hypothetical protein
VLPDHLGRNGNNTDRRGGHRGIFIVAFQAVLRMGIRATIASCSPRLYCRR